MQFPPGNRAASALDALKQIVHGATDVHVIADEKSFFDFLLAAVGQTERILREGGPQLVNGVPAIRYRDLTRMS